jgi:hypothetical protein
MIIEVQFSGNGKGIYPYIYHGAAPEARISNRVVVPTKMKDDGTVSLSIANIVEVWADEVYFSEHPDAKPVGIKPVVAFINSETLAIVTEAVRCIEIAGTVA